MFVRFCSWICFHFSTFGVSCVYFMNVFFLWFSFFLCLSFLCCLFTVFFFFFWIFFFFWYFFFFYFFAVSFACFCFSFVRVLIWLAFCSRYYERPLQRMIKKNRSKCVACSVLYVLTLYLYTAYCFQIFSASCAVPSSIRGFWFWFSRLFYVCKPAPWWGILRLNANEPNKNIQSSAP